MASSMAPVSPSYASSGSFSVAMILVILAVVVAIAAIVVLIVCLATKPKANRTPRNPDESYFDGGFFSYLGYHLLAGLLTTISFGIAFPWVCCMVQRWKARHTVVNGKRMYFDGTGGQLIGKFLLWLLLSIITFGIYSFWMALAVKKWITKHTHFEGEEDSNSYFDGRIFGFIGIHILRFLVTLIPLVGLAWSDVLLHRWEARHTVVDSRRLVFVGSVGTFFGKYLLWGFLSVITFGIYGLFLPVNMMRLKASNTIDHEHTAQARAERSAYCSKIQSDAAGYKSCRVEDEMECMRAGITDTMSQEALLELANSGVRSAQYTYVTRCANGAYDQEPYASLLKASAQAEYAPAMCLYGLQADTDPTAVPQLLDKAAQRGQLPAIRACMNIYGREGLEMGHTKQALPRLKAAVRWAHILEASDETLTAEEETLVRQCVVAIRRLEIGVPKPSRGGGVVVTVLAIILGMALVAGTAVGAVSLLRVGSVKQPAAIVQSAPSAQIPETLWDSYTDMLIADNNQVTELYTDGNTTAYEVTCNYWYWTSDFEIHVTRSGDFIEKIVISGDRTYLPEEPEMNQEQMVWAVRALFNCLELGSFEDMDPYTGNGEYLENHGRWTFSYNNDDVRMEITVTG